MKRNINKFKYPLADVYKNLKNKDTRFVLEAEIMPWVGRMYNV